MMRFNKGNLDTGPRSGGDSKRLGTREKEAISSCQDGPILVPTWCLNHSFSAPATLGTSIGWRP